MISVTQECTVFVANVRHRMSKWLMMSAFPGCFHRVAELVTQIFGKLYRIVSHGYYLSLLVKLSWFPINVK